MRKLQLLYFRLSHVDGIEESLKLWGDELHIVDHEQALDFEDIDFAQQADAIIIAETNTQEKTFLYASFIANMLAEQKVITPLIVFSNTTLKNLPDKDALFLLSRESNGIYSVDQSALKQALQTFRGKEDQDRLPTPIKNNPQFYGFSIDEDGGIAFNGREIIFTNPQHLELMRLLMKSETGEVSRDEVCGELGLPGKWSSARYNAFLRITNGLNNDINAAIYAAGYSLPIGSLVHMKLHHFKFNRPYLEALVENPPLSLTPPSVEKDIKFPHLLPRYAFH